MHPCLLSDVDVAFTRSLPLLQTLLQTWPGFPLAPALKEVLAAPPLHRWEQCQAQRARAYPRCCPQTPQPFTVAPRKLEVFSCVPCREVLSSELDPHESRAGLTVEPRLSSDEASVVGAPWGLHHDQRRELSQTVSRYTLHLAPRLEPPCARTPTERPEAERLRLTPADAFACEPPAPLHPSSAAALAVCRL